MTTAETHPLIADDSDDSVESDDSDGVSVARRRRALAQQEATRLSARASPRSAAQSPYAAQLEAMQSGKVSIEREGDATSLVHFATGQAVIEQQLVDSGVREAFLNDRSIALIEQTNEHDLLLDADRAIAAALLGGNSQNRRKPHRRRDELEVRDAISCDSDSPHADAAELVPLESPPKPVTNVTVAPLTKLDAMQLLKTLQACDLITPQCRQFYTRKLVNTTAVGEADGALALMAAFGDNLAELAAELHTYADLPPPAVQIATAATDAAAADPDAPRRRRSSSHRAAKEKSRPPTGPPLALAPALVKKPSTAAASNVGSGRLRVRFADATDDNNDHTPAPAAAAVAAAAADDDDESGDPLDKAEKKSSNSSGKKSRKKHHHRSSSQRNAANFAPVSAAARANAKMFRIDKPQTNAAFDERLTKIMNDI